MLVLWFATIRVAKSVIVSLNIITKIVKNVVRVPTRKFFLGRLRFLSGLIEKVFSERSFFFSRSSQFSVNIVNGFYCIKVINRNPVLRVRIFPFNKVPKIFAFSTF